MPEKEYEKYQMYPKPRREYGLGPGAKTFESMRERRDWGKELERRKKIEKEAERRKWEYEQYHEPYVGKTGDLLEQEAQRAYDRQLALARMNMGYAATSGYGAGRWDAAQTAIEAEAAKKYMELESIGERFGAEQRLRFMEREDYQSHQQEMARINAAYQAQLAAQQAELNDPSWWQMFGGIAGTGLALMTGGLGFMVF